MVKIRGKACGIIAFILFIVGLLSGAQYPNSWFPTIYLVSGIILGFITLISGWKLS